MPKKNYTSAARRARAAQQVAPTIRYTALLRAATSNAAAPFVAGLTLRLVADPAVVSGREARRDWARMAADALFGLSRASTGGTYPAVADLAVVAPPEGDEALVVVVTVVARRPWRQAGEWEAVMEDVRAALAGRPGALPGAPEGYSEVEPVGSFAADAMCGQRPGQRSNVELRLRPAHYDPDPELLAALDSDLETYPAPHWPESLERTAPYRPDLKRFAEAGEDPARWGRLLCLQCGCPVAWACPDCPGCYCWNDRCPDVQLRHRQQNLDETAVFMLTAWVPADVDERAFAQQVADMVRWVTRESTGETYPGRATVVRLNGLWRALAGQAERARDMVEARLLVLCETVRDWGIDGEFEDVETDMRTAIEHGVTALYPALWGPVAFPVDHRDVEAQLERRAWAVATSDADPLVLRADWHEELEQLNATAPFKPAGIRGGQDKTSHSIDLAAGLAAHDNRVRIIDLDGPGSLPPRPAVGEGRG